VGAVGYNRAVVKGRVDSPSPQRTLRLWSRPLVRASARLSLVIESMTQKLGPRSSPLHTMRLSVLTFALGVVALMGCSSNVSMPGRVREKFAPTYHTHVVSADQRKTYEAAKAALKQMDFRFVNGGPAQGKLSAINGLVSSNDLRSARQLTLDVKLTAVTEGTEVSALFSEVREDSFNTGPGLGTSLPVRETGIYDVFFQNIEAALAPHAK